MMYFQEIVPISPPNKAFSVALKGIETLPDPIFKKVANKSAIISVVNQRRYDLVSVFISKVEKRKEYIQVTIPDEKYGPNPLR